MSREEGDVCLRQILLSCLLQEEYESTLIGVVPVCSVLPTLGPNRGDTMAGLALAVLSLKSQLQYADSDQRHPA